MNVLLVEDDAAMRKLLQLVLEDRGYDVTAVADGELGWQCYQQSDFPLVVLDWLLPGIDGLEVCRRIRHHANSVNSLVLVITRLTQPKDLEQVLAAGADDYIGKPFDAELLNIRLTIAEQRIIGRKHQQQTESERRRVQCDLEATMRAIPDLIFELDSEGRYHQVHAHQPELLALPAEKLIGKTVFDVLPIDAATEVMSGLQQAQQTGESRGKHITLELPSGTCFFELSITHKSVEFADESLSRFIVLSHDITAYTQSHQRLTQASRRLALATRAIGIGIWEYHIDNGKLEWDDQMFEMYGMTREQFPEAYEAWTRALHPHDRERAERELQAAIDGNQEFNTTFSIRLPDGQQRHIQAAALVVRDDQDNAERMIGINLDITHHKNNEQALLEAKELADFANQSKSQFLTSMSHELRTPLNAILGFSELLATDNQQPMTESQLSSLSYIISAGNQLLNLINDLLDLSRIESGKLQVVLTNDVNINALLSDVYNMMQPQAKNYAVDMVNNTLEGANPLLIRADKTKLKQVLLNIVSNAIKYNSIQGRVTLSVEQHEERRLRVLIADTGEGIPESSLAMLFEPFNRLDKANSSIEGTGIGLTICKQLVELMGGHIGVTNNPDKGMTFWVEFPQV